MEGADGLDSAPFTGELEDQSVFKRLDIKPIAEWNTQHAFTRQEGEMSRPWSTLGRIKVNPREMSCLIAGCPVSS